MFHAGTKKKENDIVAVGGRVLNFISLSENLTNARQNILNNLKKLDWNKGFYRKDIAFKVINKWGLSQENLKEKKFWNQMI